MKPSAAPGRASYVIASDALYPRDEAHRLRLYARQGDRLEVVAATDVDGLGRTLIQLDADEAERGRRILDLGALGVLDVCPSDELVIATPLGGRWLILPWHRPERETTLGPLPKEVRP